MACYYVTIAIIIFLLITQSYSKTVNATQFVGERRYCDNQFKICKSPLKCISHKCIPPDQLNKIGQSCRKTYQCQSPYECTDGMCALPKVTGRTCRREQKCPKGFICVKGRCFPQY